MENKTLGVVSIVIGFILIGLLIWISPYLDGDDYLAVSLFAVAISGCITMGFRLVSKEEVEIFYMYISDSEYVEEDENGNIWIKTYKKEEPKIK